MINIFKKKPAGKLVKLTISGMHCVSCSLNIDGELEDSEGVFSADTSYAQSEAKISFDPDKISVEKITEIVEELGYQAEPQD